MSVGSHPLPVSCLGDSNRLDRVRRGDRPTMEGIVRAYWDPIMRYYWRRVSKEEAEDLTQELFVTVYRAVREGSGPRDDKDMSWRRYLLACARHRLIDHWRRRKVRPPIAHLGDLTKGETQWQDVVGESGGSVGGATLALSAEIRRGIRECLETLDALSRFTCTLLFVDGMSKRQIARVCGRPEPSIRALLIDAVATLRRCLGHRGLAPDNLET